MAEYYSKNAFLTETEMTVNAKYIYGYLTGRGWTPQAVCGMLGNMETESTINPGIWQNLDAGNTSLGYSLVQWTPATKYINWCNDRDLEPSKMESALQRIIWELENGEQYYQTDDYPLTFAEFKVSTQSVEYLANAFLRNYERPADQTQPARATQALKWYNLLKGSEGSEGGSEGSEPDDSYGELGGNTGGSSGNTTTTKRSKMPLWLLISASKRKV